MGSHQRICVAGDSPNPKNARKASKQSALARERGECTTKCTFCTSRFIPVLLFPSDVANSCHVTSKTTPLAVANPNSAIAVPWRGRRGGTLLGVTQASYCDRCNDDHQTVFRPIWEKRQLMSVYPSYKGYSTYIVVRPHEDAPVLVYGKGYATVPGKTVWFTATAFNVLQRSYGELRELRS